MSFFVFSLLLYTFSCIVEICRLSTKGRNPSAKATYSLEIETLYWIRVFIPTVMFTHRQVKLQNRRNVFLITSNWFWKQLCTSVTLKQILLSNWLQRVNTVSLLTSTLKLTCFTTSVTKGRQPHGVDPRPACAAEINTLNGGCWSQICPLWNPMWWLLCWILQPRFTFNFNGLCLQ